MARITKATADQWRQIDELRQATLDDQTTPIDRNGAINAINVMWARIGWKPPLIVQLASPLSCCVAASQLGSQLRSQLDSQLGSQLNSQLDSQLGSQLDSQLGSQLGSQLNSQLRSQLNSQLYSQLDSQLGSQIS